MARKGMRISAIIVFFFLALDAHSLEVLSLLDFGKTMKASVAFDPLTKTGYIEQNGFFVSFALDQPFIALDWKELKKVGAPYLSGETVLLPADFVKETSKYLSEKNTPKREKYSVATILVDPGHGGKDTGASGDLGEMRLIE